MLVDEFLFDLPEELIAAFPAERRDQSRLMVVPKDEELPLQHRLFEDIREFLRPGDLMVMNDSRVIPARLYARRATGGRVEVLLLTEEQTDSELAEWRALVKPARKLHVGEELFFSEDVRATIVAEHPGGERTLRFQVARPDFLPLLNRLGQMPLPPYILKRRQLLSGQGPEELHGEADKQRYQTVYARAGKSIAAPTAGLHFTPELLADLKAMGVEQHTVTLDVGAGTFQTMPEGGRVEDHVMHFEEYGVPESTAHAVGQAKREGRRIVCVGTTSVRTIESAFDPATGGLRVGRGRTNLMIKPGYQYNLVDVLITNFHLPRSTLLLLVAALIGRDRLLAAYAEAVREKYRFFSYGDAMIVNV